MEQDILEILKNLCVSVEELKKNVIDDSKRISKIYYKINKHDDVNSQNDRKEAEVITTDLEVNKNKYDSLKLNDYTKIVLKDFESRISILEEENQNYGKL